MRSLWALTRSAARWKCVMSKYGASLTPSGRPDFLNSLCDVTYRGEGSSDFGGGGVVYLRRPPFPISFLSLPPSPLPLLVVG